MQLKVFRIKSLRIWVVFVEIQPEKKERVSHRTWLMKHP